MTDLTINGDRFRVELDGDEAKPALLLSNSLGTDLSLWDAQMPAFTGHFRVIRYDARGHGASVAAPGPYTIDQLGRDALAILDALEIETAHVIGISMGGAVAQWLMINAPDRISRAVLANTTARFMAPDVWNGRIATVLREGMDAVAAQTIERWFSGTFRAQAPDRVAAVEAAVRSTPPHGYAACGAALRDMDLREAIRAIEHPVLILTGADDSAIPAQDTMLFLEAIPGCRHVELPARHLSNVEAEAAFTEAALDFLLAKMPARRAKRGLKPGPARPASTPARRQGRRSTAARAPLPERTTPKASRPSAPRRATKSAHTTTAKAPAVKMPSAKSPATKVPAAKPLPAKPLSTKPLSTKPLSTKPLSTKPRVTGRTGVNPTAVKPSAAKTAAARPAPTKSAGTKGAGRRRSSPGTSAVKASPRASRGAAKPSPAPITRRGSSPAAKPAKGAGSTARTAPRVSKPAVPRRTAASLAAKAMRSSKAAGPKQPGRTAAATPRTSSKTAAKATATKGTAAKGTAPNTAASKASARKSKSKPGRSPTRRGAR